MFLLLITILETLFSTLSQKTLQTDFVVSVTQDIAQPLNVPGSATMHGNNFHLSLSELEVAYDGQTLYMYQADVNELTLSTPTEEELLDVNPLAFAQALVDNSNVTERPSKDGASVYVTLTPKVQNTGLQRVVLKLRRQDAMPLSMEIKEDKQNSTVTLKNPQFINSTPPFVIHKEGAYINDLR